MHHALEIQEILLTIFSFCHVPTTKPDLPALARTCRTFKEPALNVLWRELNCPYAIARCLPEASHKQISSGMTKYSFSRSLTQTEWDILQSYTRRILSIRNFSGEFDWESVRIFLNPSPTQPLLPNLRILSCICGPETKDLLSMPFPSLVSLHLGSVTHRELVSSLDSFSNCSSQTLRRILVSLGYPDITFDNYFSSYICRWRNLQSMYCPQITLSVEALMHLSSMPTLTDLDFTLSATLLERITPTDLPLIFSNLRVIVLNSTSLDLISRLLALIQLPALVIFSALLKSCPSKSDLSFLFDILQRSGTGHAIQKLSLHQVPLNRMHVGPQDPIPVLSFADLRPCIAFGNLHSLSFDVNKKVELTGGDLLSLTSAWPHIERLLINEKWGWNSPGIVPDELVRFLQTYPSLSEIAIAIDTQGYTKCPHLPLSLGSTLSPSLSIHVVDSLIDKQSIPAVAAFLAAIMPRSTFCFDAGSAHKMDDWIQQDPDQVRWTEVYKLVEHIICQNSLGTHVPHCSAPALIPPITRILS